MDLEKLLSILTYQKLFFASTRTMARDDWFEGQFTPAELIDRGLDAETMKEIDDRYHRSALSRLFFNCWHMNDGESDAMWKIYVNGTGGVAISSTTTRLRQCFQNTSEDVSLGKIRYAVGDHGYDADNLVRRYMRKKPAFRHEQEVRLVFYDEADKHSNSSEVMLNVDVPTLIEKIIVSPKAEKWFFVIGAGCHRKTRLSIRGYSV